jgi:uncharacterized protein
MTSEPNWSFEALWEHVAAQAHGGKNGLHGPKHWQRVLNFGLRIAAQSGADPTVVKLFALFHDSRRENDGHDPEHGARGAEYAKELRGKWFDLSDEAFEKLHYACTWHTDQQHHPDVTIGACWDSDRLDLGRVNIRPEPKYLNTEVAKQAAVKGVEKFLKTGFDDGLMG